MSQGETIHKKVTAGLLWTFGERITAQLVTTIVSIILARLLDPEHYGIISLVVVFVSVCNVFVTSGFGSAVVRDKDADELEFNTAFWLSLALSIIVYGLLFLAAPYVADFYKMDQLESVIRVMGVRLPLAAVNSIQQAYVRRKMIFKKFFFATLFGTVLSGGVGIALAYSGYGVWALVGQYLTNTTVDTIVLWFTCGWKPKTQFSGKSARGIFSFGWKVLLTDLIATLENDIRSLVIGKVFSPADLAFFDQGKKYPSLLVTNINSSINKVMLPAYSKAQDDLPELKKMLSKSIQMGVFFLAPMLIGFAAIAEQFVAFVLTEKWLPCVPYIQIFCIVYLTRPLETACHQALLAIGKSGVVLVVMICINAVAIVTLLLASFVFHSVILIAVGSLIVTIISLCSFMVSTKKYVHYGFSEQLHDIMPALLCSFVMAACVFLLGRVLTVSVASLLLQIVVGAGVYIACAAIGRLEQFSFAMGKIKTFLKKKT